VYSKYLSKTLAEKLEDFANLSHSEAVSLYEELAVARTAAVQSLQLAGPVLEGKVKDEQTSALAMSCLRSSMDHVKELCLAISRIEKDAEDKLSLGAVHLFTTQIVRAIYRVCGEDVELAKKIEAEIRNNVRVPDAGVAPNVSGTAVTPDQMVQMMDEHSAPSD
jgi:hypothetical protein